MGLRVPDRELELALAAVRVDERDELLDDGMHYDLWTWEDRHRTAMVQDTADGEHA